MLFDVQKLHIMPWYQFTPGGGAFNPSDRNQYTLYGDGSFPPNCPGNIRVCAIQAMDSGGLPFITTALLNEIIQALENRADSTNVLLKGTC